MVRAWAIPGVILLAAAVLLVIVASRSSAVKQPTHWKTASGVAVYGGLGPEGLPLLLGTPLAAANTGLTGQPIDGIACNTSEQLAYHHHVHLVMFVNGQPRPLPLAVGMVPPAQIEHSSAGDFAAGSQVCLYWLHVHAQDGVVHIESPAVRTYILQQVFDIWHQPLSSTRLGPYTGTVTATVDGTPWTGDPAQIPLNQHSQIVLNLGTPVVAPPPISWSKTGL